MKKEELKNDGLESVKGGHKWEMLDDEKPRFCPFWYEFRCGKVLQ